MKSHCTTVLMIALLAPLAHADDKATEKGKAITNSVPREEVREWTSGQYKVLASVVSTSGEGDQLTVSLKKADGSIAHVKASVLSMPDQEYLKEWIRAHFISPATGLKMVLIPAGTFQMGSPATDTDAKNSERPQHQVRISRDFYLGVTEVTQGQWEAVMGTRPWKRKKNVKEGSNYPATFVGWSDAVEFCKRLSDKEGRRYRLPTEAEWEYACRAGTTTKYSFGDDKTKLGDYAWFGGFDGAGNTKTEQYAHQVGKKRPNPWGLYDMHGNVAEWCQDWKGGYPSGSVTDPTGPATASFHILRGGSWSQVASICRSGGNRHFSGKGPGINDLGFRIAQQVPLPVKKPASGAKSGGQ